MLLFSIRSKDFFVSKRSFACFFLKNSWKIITVIKAERAAEKERGDKILSFVQEMGAEGIEDLQDVYKMMIGAVLEGDLKAPFVLSTYLSQYKPNGSAQSRAVCVV